MFRPFLAPLAGLCALALSGRAHAAGPDDLYYERTLMARAGALCPALFDPPILVALTASARQARGAALQAGVSAADLDATAERARTKAESVGCGSADLKTAAARVKKAFAGWAALPRMSFPGPRTAWTAVRADRPVAPRWTLSAPLHVAGAAATMGLTSEAGGDAFTLVAAGPLFPGAYAVRLVVRDPGKAPAPYLAGDATPPREDTVTVLAAERGPAPASLLPPGAAAGDFVRFPPAAAQALSRLDPREGVRIEWVFSGPTGADRIMRLRFDAGDFAAGRAFLQVKR